VSSLSLFLSDRSENRRGKRGDSGVIYVGYINIISINI